MKPSSGLRLAVRPYVAGMVPGIGEPVGTMRWYQQRLDVWSDEARQHIHFGRADLAASYAQTCVLYARLMGHYSTFPPEDVQ